MNRVDLHTVTLEVAPRDKANLGSIRSNSSSRASLRGTRSLSSPVDNDPFEFGFIGKSLIGGID